MPSLKYRCGEYLLDPANRRFIGPTGPTALEPRVFAVIMELVTHADALVTRDALLDAVWGHRYATPSTLNRVITLARRAFSDDGTTPRHIETVYGAGYRYIGPVEIEDGSGKSQAARFGPPPRCWPPARTQTLIGREEDLTKLAALVDAHRAVSLLGPGGMGKTQCAIELAQRVAHRFPGGVWFFDLVAMESGEEWFSALAAALTISGAGPASLQEQIAAQIRDRQMLLVLDNCDRIAAQVGALVIELLRLTRAPRFLATTQAPLLFAGEQLYRLGPLSLVGQIEPGAPALQTIASAPAVEMLVTRAQLAQPDFSLTEANAAAIHEICRRLDAMPLALEFAAARFNLLSPEQILERLDQRFRFLNSAASGVDVRHRNLLALLDWSYSLLSTDEQRLLNWCGVFVQGWTVEGLLPVGAALGHSGESTVELLSSLVNHSLVSVDVSLAPPRYRLLETVREYAMARLANTREEGAARTAHLKAIEQVCVHAHADVLAGRMMVRARQLAREYGNIRAAVEWACATPELLALGQSVVGSLLFFIRNHDSYGTVRELARRLLDAPPRDPTPQRARCLLAFGITQTGATQLSVKVQAGDSLREAALIAGDNGDRWSFAYAQAWLAMWHSEQGSPDKAAAPMASSERVIAQLADPLLQGLGGFARGWYRLAQGDPASAARELEIARDLGTDLIQQQFIGIYVGLAYYLTGDYARSAQGFQQSLQQCSILGSLRFAAGNIEGTAYLCIVHGQYADAVRLLAAARGIRERTAPLLSFWVSLHEEAVRRVRSALTAADYELADCNGREWHDEEAIEEALRLLRQFSESGVLTNSDK
jgi:predicted ATPase/DNA-binding winged helix-turn-helix (wHTH) protein